MAIVGPKHDLLSGVLRLQEPSDIFSHEAVASDGALHGGRQLGCLPHDAGGLDRPAVLAERSVIEGTGTV